MKAKLKSSEVEKLKSAEVEELKSSGVEELKSLGGRASSRAANRNLSTLNSQPSTLNLSTVEEVYRQCLKRETDRERSHRDTKQGAFEASMLSFDRLMAEIGDPSKSATFSDNGTGEEAIVAACDGEGSKTPLDRGCESKRRDILRNARKRLKRAHPELLEVFNLIVKNGKNRKESIWALMMSKDTAGGTPPKSGTGAI